MSSLKETVDKLTGNEKKDASSVYTIDSSGFNWSNSLQVSNHYALFCQDPEPKSQLTVGNNHLVIQFCKPMPNWWFRLFQYLFCGFTWKDPREEKTNRTKVLARLINWLICKPKSIP